MNLTDRLDKLKQSGKRAALALSLGSSLVYNSGCGAFILGVAMNSAAETQAQATRDAAEIEAQSRENIARMQAQNQGQIYNKINVEVDESKREGITTYKNFDGYLGGQPCPLTTFGEETFKSYENFGFRIALYNKTGKVANFYILRKENLKVIKKEKILIDKSDFYKIIKLKNNLKKGSYYGKIEIGNQTPGIKEIEIID